MRTIKSGKTGPLFVRSAGVIVWLSTGIPAILLLLQTPAPLDPIRLWLWFGAFLIFGLGFWHTSRVAGAARRDRSTAVWLGLQPDLVDTVNLCQRFADMPCAAVTGHAFNLHRDLLSLCHFVPSVLLFFTLSACVTGHSGRWPRPVQLSRDRRGDG